MGIWQKYLGAKFSPERRAHSESIACGVFGVGRKPVTAATQNAENPGES